jgi:hypothetical protein
MGFFPLDYHFVFTHNQGSADDGGDIRRCVRIPIYSSQQCTSKKACILTNEVWGAYSVRARLKDILRQYELRERHFECVIRSKELEVLLSRARAAEQKQLAEGEKTRAQKVEEEVRPRPFFFMVYKRKSTYGFFKISSSAEPTTSKGVG